MKTTIINLLLAVVYIWNPLAPLVVLSGMWMWTRG